MKEVRKLTKEDKVVLLNALKSGEIATEDVEKLLPERPTKEIVRPYFWTALSILDFMTTDAVFIEADNDGNQARFTMKEAVDKFKDKVLSLLGEKEPPEEWRIRHEEIKNEIV